MKFRVGDVVEIIKVYKDCNQSWIGREVTVTGFNPGKVWRGGDRGAVITAPDLPDGNGWSPEQLRLKRPPSWDKWITDTRDVQTEREVEAM